MKINNIFKASKVAAFSLAVTSLALVSCEQEDFTTDKEEYEAVPKITLSGDILNNPLVITEQSRVDTIKVSLDKPYVVDTPVNIRVKEGTATKDADFKLTRAMIESGDTTGIILIESLITGDEWDTEAEENESVILEVYPGANLEGEAQEISIEYLNYVHPDLGMNITWDIGGSYLEDFQDSLAGNQVIDLDFYLYDAEGTLVGGSATGGFETFYMNSALPDGDYSVVGEVWSSTDFGSYGPYEVPVTISHFQDGKYGDVTFKPMTKIDTDYEGENLPYAVVRKAGTSYEVFTFEEYETMEPAKAAQFKATSNNGGSLR